MSTPSLVPADFTVPIVYETGRFRLRMLATTDVDKDYEAVMESVTLLNRMFGQGWPTPTFSWEENLRDLAEHQAEFERREAFAYTVVTLDEGRCLGCLYINPARDGKADARVHMWVRQSEYERGLDPILFRTVSDWLERAWPFEKIEYVGRDERGLWRPLDRRRG
ncbi:MAG: hypothetical protein KDD73_04490 [Anaerolineales bacterium]|nr:hypothetical protein [Anaerolineales bacterium]MCB9128964.1 GNAT family N-acetyltransferase [Ardenticatenales bacterium]